MQDHCVGNFKQSRSMFIALCLLLATKVSKVYVYMLIDISKTALYLVWPPYIKMNTIMKS